MANEVNSDFEVILYNRIRPYDKIVKEVFSNSMSSTYILQSRKELRMFADERTYHFLKDIVMPHKIKHVATISECFEIEMSSSDEKECFYCVISEPLNRDFVSEETKQSGINLFRDAWMEYLHCTVNDVYCRIDEAYASKDSVGEKYILQCFKTSAKSPEVIKVAIALNDAFKGIMSLGPVIIWPYPINIGLSDDNIVKITHIGIR